MLKAKNILLSTVVVIFSSFFFFAPALAQTTMPITVAPARQEITVDPGQQTAVNVKFYNLGDTPISGIIKVADFIVDNDQGAPRIIENITQASPRFAASHWFTLPYDRITIASEDKVSIQAKINVPSNARPGGRYVAIYFEPTSTIPRPVGAEREAGSGIAPRIASLVYIRVSGPIKEQALISRLFAPFFWEYGPVKVTAEILNRGDYHIRPKGVFTMTNMFGGVVDQVSLKEANIFPDRSRTFTAEIGKKWMFGKYKIALQASYGSQGKLMEKAIEVWVFPWRVTLVTALSIIIVSYLIYHLYKTTRLRQELLEKELEREKEELEKLKERLKKREE